MKHFLFFFLLCTLYPVQIFAQGETAVPFLLITSSPEGNGMGGIAASILSANPTASIANPGQIGYGSLQNYFSANFYTPKVDWLPGFHFGDLWYNVHAVNYGINFNKIAPSSVPISIGFGYSKIFISLGNFIVTGPDSPEPIDTFYAFEQSEQYTMGVGFDYFIKGGIGLTQKNILSSLGGWISGDSAVQSEGRQTAIDIGGIVQVPLAELFISQEEKETKKLLPTLNMTIGAVRSNIGGKISYIDQAQADQLHHLATLGASWEIGVTMLHNSVRKNILSFTLSRQAEDILVRRYQDEYEIYRMKYQTGFGDIQPYNNLIAGKYGGGIYLRKGWQINIADAVFLRGGSVNARGLRYNTTGFGFSLQRIFQFLSPALSSTPAESSSYDFFTQHFDVQYNYASYEASDRYDFSPIAGTLFQSVNFIIK